MQHNGVRIKFCKYLYITCKVLSVKVELIRAFEGSKRFIAGLYIHVQDK